MAFALAFRKAKRIEGRTSFRSRAVRAVVRGAANCRIESVRERTAGASLLVPDASIQNATIQWIARADGRRSW